MPSEFENLGNVVLEGLVRKIPCIATNGSPWEELNTESCGWQVPYTQKDITNAVYKAMKTNKEDIAQMGENGYHLMERRYSVEAVAKSIQLVYEWILGGKKPDFVYLC
jgi:glycosyltransferase involved in cell wall biosynthesis